MEPVRTTLAAILMVHQNYVSELFVKINLIVIQEIVMENAVSQKEIRTYATVLIAHQTPRVLMESVNLVNVVATLLLMNIHLLTDV